MTKKEQLQLVANLFNEILETLEQKGDDYASNADRLSNFKKTAALMGMSPTKVSLIYLSTKLVRLMELIDGGKSPKNEPIKDTIIDMVGYLALLKLLIYDDK